MMQYMNVCKNVNDHRLPADIRVIQMNPTIAILERHPIVVIVFTSKPRSS